MLPAINPKKETQCIASFLKQTFKKQGIDKAVIGLSGGIDSTLVYYLLKQVLPEKNIIGVSLPYFDQPAPAFAMQTIPIKKMVNCINDELLETKNARLRRLGTQVYPDDSRRKIAQQAARFSNNDKIHLGNIMARVRMIALFDLAKKNNALVVGTENRTEHLLGYFTRFGDAASDIEPICHLYKIQVYQLAKYLKIPQKIIDKSPSANLWQGQTDEGEFDFTYEEADQVLFLFFDQKMTVGQITENGFKNAKKILNFAKKNEFKLTTPYHV